METEKKTETERKRGGRQSASGRKKVGQGKERKEEKNKRKSESPGNALFEARFAVAGVLPCFAALPSLPSLHRPSLSATKSPNQPRCCSVRPVLLSPFSLRCAVLRCSSARSHQYVASHLRPVPRASGARLKPRFNGRFGARFSRPC
jgi:hypothetical protein